MSQEEGIQRALESFGFKVEKIDERIGIKTPDFYATKDGDAFTIELKTKYMNPTIIQNMQQAFGQGEMHTSIIPLNFNTTYQKVIHKAKDQLKSEPIYEESFNIAWFHCEGSDAGTIMEIFENTLYGKAYGADFKDDHNKNAYECYYYKEIAMFYKYKDILDGAVISMDGSIKVLLNILSPKYEELKNSSLCITLKEGVQDPYERESRGEALVINEEMYGRNINLEIQKKYGMKSFMVFPMQSYTISAPFP